MKYSLCVFQSLQSGRATVANSGRECRVFGGMFAACLQSFSGVSQVLDSMADT